MTHNAKKPRLRVRGGSVIPAPTPPDNLDLWRQVEKTPTDVIKQANIDGQELTTLDHMYVVQLATKLFGPIGIGWGYRIDEDRYDQGAPILDNKTGAMIAHEQTHTIRLVLWYRWHGHMGEVTQFGHTRAVYLTRSGHWKTDGEAPKKSVSDAIKKCLSLLGFAADVYTGQFDKRDYREQRNAETRIAKADDADAEILRLRQEYADWLSRECDTLRNKIPHPKSIALAADSILSRVRDKASMARVEPDRGLEMVRRAAEDGTERVIAERAAKRQPEETTP